MADALPELSCPAQDLTADSNYLASFPITYAGSIATGTCVAGKNGLPQRQCYINGTWAPSILLNPCSADTCPALLLDNNANWTVGTPTVQSTGVCVAGWFGSPKRMCLSTGWQPPTVQCQRTCAVLGERSPNRRAEGTVQ